MAAVSVGDQIKKLEAKIKRTSEKQDKRRAKLRSLRTKAAR